MRPIRYSILSLTIASAVFAGFADETDREWEKTFVGAEACKQCHENEYEAWARSRHAGSFSKLTSSEKSDAGCIQCHTTGISSVQFHNVQCESCHGGGKYYSSEVIMKNRKLAIEKGLMTPSRDVCENCHNTESGMLDRFDYSASLNRIRHWGFDKNTRTVEQPLPNKTSADYINAPRSSDNPSDSDDASTRRIKPHLEEQEEQEIPSDAGSTLN